MNHPRCMTIPEFPRRFRLGRDRVLGYIRRKGVYGD